MAKTLKCPRCGQRKFVLIRDGHIALADCQTRRLTPADLEGWLCNACYEELDAAALTAERAANPIKAKPLR